ncbi:hypothetical protein [Cohaesibacter intestini]|uniref:hypothetical protein n=1 Tax=Cohaesibacter intestini TaxID=2211145 RepID=UPI000DEB46C3|nr:hypothetical protein [Cohaesibacter intestini]
MVSSAQAIKQLTQRLLAKCAPHLMGDMLAEAERAGLTLTSELEQREERAKITLSGSDLLTHHYGTPDVPADHSITRILTASANNRRRSP